MHFTVPKPRKFIVNFPGLLILDRPTNGVIGAGEVALCFEFDIRDKVILRTPHKAMVSKLILHLSE
jgi:hypothetical protein